MDAIVRNTAEWVKFVEAQKLIIIGRLNRYNDIPTIKIQLSEIGDLTLYQKYKINVVSNYLRKILTIKSEDYGICKDCRCEIPLERLKIVPGASRCTKCESSENKKAC